MIKLKISHFEGDTQRPPAAAAAVEDATQTTSFAGLAAADGCGGDAVDDADCCSAPGTCAAAAVAASNVPRSYSIAADEIVLAVAAGVAGGAVENDISAFVDTENAHD